QELHHVHAAGGVAGFVVVPGYDLEEPLVQLDAGLGVEDGAVVVADEVAGDDLLVGVAEDALHGAFGGGPHGGADFGVGRVFSGLEGQVDRGHVGGGDAEGHASELALERGDTQGDCLGGARGGGDDVHVGVTSAAPVFLGWAVLRRLRGGRGVDR